MRLNVLVNLDLMRFCVIRSLYLDRDDRGPNLNTKSLTKILASCCFAHATAIGQLRED